MKIAIDAMGGDFAPSEVVQGAARFLGQNTGSELLLVGRQHEIATLLGDKVSARCVIIDSPDVIGMDESPATALRRKPRASISVAAQLVKEGRADAFVSAGSTGAMMAAALFAFGRIPGVERPAVSVLLPTHHGKGVLVLDVGANVDVKPHHLVQFAMMGSAYVQKIFAIDRPRVALLNVGAEPGKGNELAKAAAPLLGQVPTLNFVGNIEGDSLWEGLADVVVCDGFVGNVLLKTSEGVADLVIGTIREGVKSAGLDTPTAAKVFAGLNRFRADSPEYAGAPLLGVNGVGVVCHGKAKSPTIANALRLAEQYVNGGVVSLIHERLTAGGDLAKER